MENAIWLFRALPHWYFGTILAPFGANYLSAIPAFGILCLVAGVIMGLFQRRRRLLMFLALPAASQVLVVVAGFLRGELGITEARVVLLAFLTLHTMAAAYIVARCRPGRLAAILLAVFATTYALFAAFVAGMSLTETWL